MKAKVHFMIRIFLLISFSFDLFANDLDQFLKMIESNSKLVKVEDHKVESSKFKMLESKEKRYLNPSLNTGLSRQDGKTSLSARINQSIYNSRRDINQYLKDQTLLEISKQDRQIVLSAQREELVETYLELLKKLELQKLYDYSFNQIEKAIKKLRESTKLKVTSQLSLEEAQLDFDEISFRRSENLNQIENLKSTIRFLTGNSTLNLDGLTQPENIKFELANYKKILTDILEDGSNPLLKKADLQIDLGNLEKKIGLSNYNLNVSASAGGQYYKNELEKNSEWRETWVYSLSANYPILGYSSKKYFEKSYHHKRKSDEAYKEHQTYQISLEVLTRLEELDLIYKLHGRMLQNISTLSKFWEERDLLYFSTSITTFKQFYTLLRSELSVRQNELDLRYSILLKERLISELLRKNKS